ncbi:MAG: LamG domain-containing protein [Nannocystales bacterium]
MGRGHAGRIAAAALMLMTASACPAATYRCRSDEQCPLGSCVNDACAFVDDDCPSGMRFAAHSVGGLGGACVPVREESSTSDSTSGMPQSSSSSSPDPFPTSTSTASSSSTGAATAASSTSGTEASSSTGPPPDPDLVAWFSCEEEGESIGLDASGNGHDGLCTSCPTSTPGIVGQACDFDEGDFLAVPFDAAFSVEEFTLAVWLLPDELPTDRLLSAAGLPIGAGEANAYQLGFNGLSGSQWVFFCYGSADTQQCLNQPVVLGDWIHVATTWSEDGARLYFDGALVLEGPPTPPEYGMEDFLIGMDIDNDAPAHGFAGLIDELRVYSRALTDAEVAELASL